MYTCIPQFYYTKISFKGVTLDGHVFLMLTGDTLFSGGCGRFFEGSPSQMYKALVEILAKLPENTVSLPITMAFCLSKT